MTAVRPAPLPEPGAEEPAPPEGRSAEPEPRAGFIQGRLGLEGQPGIRPVTVAEVERFFASNNDRVRALIAGLIPTLPAERACPCGTAMQGAVIGG